MPTSKLTLTLACTLLCTTLFAQQKGTFTDTRDGKIYKTVKIGEQVWMAENLNYEAEGSICYNESAIYCNKYGRLYNWETAMKACPSGWHLPDTTEWQTLVSFAGGNKIAGKKLKAKSNWYKNGNGTDNYGFSALPGGLGRFEGLWFFYNVGKYGYWWSSSEDRVFIAFFQYQNEYHGEGDLFIVWYKGYLSSVRCIQDTPTPTKGSAK